MVYNADFDPGSYFNQAWLALLPKKPHHVDPERGDIYSPDNLRPLSIVSCFNRIIASAFRYKLSEKMDRVIGDTQRGFMAGRQIIENVLEIDLEMIRASASDEDSAAILFDFTAAFPSVSHKCLWAVMKKWVYLTP